MTAALSLIALVSVIAVLYDISERNKQNEIIYHLLSNDTKYVMESSSLATLSDIILSDVCNNFTADNIKGIQEIKSTLNILCNDSSYYERVKDCKSYLAVYNSGRWVVLIKTDIKVPSQVKFATGNEYKYVYIASEKFERPSIIEMNRAEKEAVVISANNTSQFHIYELTRANDRERWICHDFYFNGGQIEILSFYNHADNIGDNITKNPSPLINSCKENMLSYRYTYSDGKAVSRLVYAASTAVIAVAPQDETAAKAEEPAPRVEEPAVTALPEIKKDPSALFYTSNIISHGPFFVNNHTNKQGNIILQDNKNNIYYLNTDGKQKWQFNADAQIIGDVTIVDLYKNNKTQYLFNTKTRLYVLDINGNHVKGFPIILPVQAANKIIIENVVGNDNFDIIYLASDNNCYILADNNGDVRLKAKISGVAVTKDPVQVVSTGKSSHIVLEKTDNGIAFYTFAGQLYFTADNSFTPGKNPCFYNNSTNSKGTYLSNNNEGKISYISKNAKTQYTDFGTFDSSNRLYYFDITKSGYNDFLIIDGSDIAAYDRFKKEIFSAKITLSSVDETKIFFDSKFLDIILFSAKDNVCTVFQYDISNKKLKTTNLESTTEPAKTANNRYLTTNAHNLFLR